MSLLDIVEKNVGITQGGMPVSPTNPLAVSPTSSTPATYDYTYNEVTSVASGILTTVATYTAPAAARLRFVGVSGDNSGSIFTVLVNATVINKRVLYWGNFNEDFYFDDGFHLALGDVVKVQAIHSRPFVASFNADIIVLRP